MFKKSLLIFILSLGFSFPSSLDIPIKSRVHSGYVVQLEDRKEVKQCLVEALYYEAANQPIEGKKAILQVISNRKNSKGFPNTLCKVVHQPKAFSYRNHLKPGQKLDIKPKNPIDKRILIKIESLVDKFLDNNMQEVISTKVLWYTRKEVKTVWMKKMKIHATIQDHKFLEEI